MADDDVARAAKGWVGPFRRSFPDFDMEIVDLIAEGDKVVAYFKCSGTHRGEWLGVEPTGKRFEGVDEIYIFRIINGKLASAVAVEDNLMDVIRVIDEFCMNRSVMVNVGDEKGEILDRAVRRASPKLLLELGTYCGYSALRMACVMPPDARLCSNRVQRGQRCDRTPYLGPRRNRRRADRGRGNAR